jgi:hypothetical protein
VAALASLRTLESVAQLRGKAPEQIVGRRRAAQMLGRDLETPVAAGAGAGA